MNPIIKWAGGKEKELPYIKENLPNKIDRYIEPFVGGGAVYFDLNIKNSLINDKSEELINLYKCIKDQDKEFFTKLKALICKNKSNDLDRISETKKPLPTSFLTWIEAFEHLMRRRFSGRGNAGV